MHTIFVIFDLSINRVKMKIKALLLIITLISISSVYGAYKRKTGWQEYGIIGKVRSMTEQSYDVWETDSNGTMIGVEEGSDFLRFEFSRRGKEKTLKRDFSSGGYDAKRRKIIEYDQNGNVKHIIKKVKSTPDYELYKYYDADNNFVMTREVFTTGSTMRYVMRNLSDDSQTVGETFYDDCHRIAKQVFTFPGGREIIRYSEYLRVDDYGNWLEAIVTDFRNGCETQELRVRTYFYY